MVFFQLPENSADNGFTEEFGLIGNFILDAKIFDDFIFRIVKYQYLPVFASSGAKSLLFFMCSYAHRQLALY
jgi:hypothetical protein